MDLGKYLVVMLGGGIGSLIRYITGIAIMSKIGGRFPVGTLVINVSGSFLIGLLMTLLTERFQPHPYWRLLLVVGFLGGLHHLFHFRVRNLPGCPRRGCLAWIRQCHRQCGFGLSGGLDRHSPC